jgi:hypothetical protein
MDLSIESKSMKSRILSNNCMSVALQRAVIGVAFTSLLVLGGCGGDEPTATPTPPSVTVETGGMPLAGATDAAAATLATETAATAPATEATQAATVESAATVAPAEASGLEPGAKVAAVGRLRLYAEPDAAAQRLAQYPADAQFVVVEPSGQFDAYPVEVGGAYWYRVRAPDGLVGWAMASAIAAQ